MRELKLIDIKKKNKTIFSLIMKIAGNSPYRIITTKEYKKLIKKSNH